MKKPKKENKMDTGFTTLEVPTLRHKCLALAGRLHGINETDVHYTGISEDKIKARTVSRTPATATLPEDAVHRPPLPKK